MLQATTVITDAEGSEVVTAYATLVVGGQEDDR
jgi:hypothetical protein